MLGVFCTLLHVRIKVVGTANFNICNDGLYFVAALYDTYLVFSDSLLLAFR